MTVSSSSLIPAEAGTQAELVGSLGIQTTNPAWVPACAGMSGIFGAIW